MVVLFDMAGIAEPIGGNSDGSSVENSSLMFLLLSSQAVR